MKEKFITQEFVAPIYCNSLRSAGIIHHGDFFWRKFDDEDYNIWTYSFDLDGYYKEGDLLVNSFSTYFAVPAFSLKDLERCIPGDYLINRSGDTYVLSCDQIYELPRVRKRSPTRFIRHDGFGDGSQKAIPGRLLQHQVGSISLVRFHRYRVQRPLSKGCY